jgi:hypothetical protein
MEIPKTRRLARFLGHLNAAGVIALVVWSANPAAYGFTNMATKLTGGVGVAADPSGNAVYYVDLMPGH